MYTTIDKIRYEAGFQDNFNILDSTIENYQTEANAHVNSIVGSRYNLSKLTGAVFTNSGAQKLLDMIEKLLAAGNLENSEYPGEEGDDTQSGQIKISKASDMLEQISLGNIKLLDTSFAEFSLLADNSSGGLAVLTNQDFSCNDFKPTDQW